MSHLDGDSVFTEDTHQKTAAVEHLGAAISIGPRIERQTVAKKKA